MTPEPHRPAQLGPYRLIAEIGSGGMGVVYRGVHVETRSQVAVKTVRVARPSLLATLRREIRALTRLNHPGIVRVLDEGVEDAVPWYAMELLQGRTLAEFRDNSKISTGNEDATTSRLASPDLGSTPSVVGAGAAHPRPATIAARRPANPWLSEGLTVVGQLCPTLSFLHGSGIVHRDLKPSNILIRPDGTPVLTDFGLVSLVSDAGGRQVLDVDRKRVGTPGYMSPEQIQGQVGDARIDLYALGCILYELVAGELPFVGRTLEDLLSRHLGAEARPLAEFVDDVPPGLQALILRLLVKEPRQRIGYADDVALALEELGVPRATVPDELRPRAYLYRAPLVGRSALCDRIEARVARCAANRRGGVVLLGAESGAGKTTLASAVGRLAEALDVDVIVGACQSASPLQPFRPLLQAITDRCVSEGPAATKKLLGPRGKVLGAYEPALAQVAQSITGEPPADLPPDAARDRVLATLTEVLARFVERRPLLLILDDLQWADDLSINFLQSLVDGGGERLGLLILGTYRVEEVGAELRRLSECPGVESIPLPPLDEQSIAALAGEMLALRDVPASLSGFLARASAGNPLFVGEYLRAAVGEGLLRRESGSWRAAAPSGPGDIADYERLPLPASLQALVLRRLEGVKTEARLLLEAAAVIGKEFDLDLLLTMTGGSKVEGLDALGELIDAHLFEQTSDTKLAFVHDKIREIEYARLGEERRRQLHRAAGASLETRATGTADLPLCFGQLAHHWKGAGDAAKAVEYLEKAGEHALGTSAYVDALVYLNEAVDLQSREQVAADRGRRAHWHFMLGEVHRCNDDFGKSRHHLLEAVALHGWPVPKSRLGLVGGILREAMHQVLHRWGISPRPSSGSTPGLEEAAHAYVSLLPTSRVTGDPLLPLYATLRGLNLAEASGSPALCGAGYGLIQILLAAASMPKLAARYDVHLRRELDKTTDAAARAQTMLFAAVYHLLAGHWTACLAIAEEVRTLASQVGLRRIWEEASTVLGGVHTYRVQATEGIAVHQEISDSAQRGADRVQSWALTGIAVLSVRSGQLDRAQAAVERASHLRAEKLDVVDGVLINSAAALVSLHLGDHREARERAERAAAHLARTPSFVTEQLAGIIWLMEVYVALWRHEAPGASASRLAELEGAARKICNKAVSMAGRVPFVRPEAYYWLGECDWLGGHPARARRRWERACASAKALDMPYQRGLAERALSTRRAG
jgi:eukaryotic-like serine/threonine-protein kinase